MGKHQLLIFSIYAFLTLMYSTMIKLLIKLGHCIGSKLLCSYLGRGSAISSAQEGRSGNIRVDKLLRCMHFSRKIMTIYIN